VKIREFFRRYEVALEMEPGSATERYAAVRGEDCLEREVSEANIRKLATLEATKTLEERRKVAEIFVSGEVRQLLKAFEEDEIKQCAKVVDEIEPRIREFVFRALGVIAHRQKYGDSPELTAVMLAVNAAIGTVESENYEKFSDAGEVLEDILIKWIKGGSDLESEEK